MKPQEGPAARVAAILALLEPWVETEFVKGRRAGRYERRGAYAFDGPRGEAAGPQLATTGAVVFAVAALLAVLASIDHTARSLQVESIAERVSQAAIAIARDEYPLLDERHRLAPADAERVRAAARAAGWAA